MPTIVQEQIDDLIGDIYDSANAPTTEGWKPVYEKFSRLMGSGPGSLNYFDKRTSTFNPIADTNDDGFLDEVNSTLYEILPFRQDLERLRSGETFIRERDCPDNEYVPTQLYQDHFRRFGIYHVAHHSLLEDRDTALTITFTRPEGRPNFGQAEFDALDLISPHLRRAICLQSKLIEAERSYGVLTDAWDHIHQGVILLSRNGDIILKNHVARTLLSHNDGIRLDRKGALVCRTSSDTNRLRGFVSGVFEPDADHRTAYGGSMQIARSHGLHPLTLFITPCSNRQAGSAASECMALILITDPDQTVGSLEHSLGQLYGLTPAESRLAARLADGSSVKEAAGELQITVNTARTHLKHIFAKTDTHRQSSLVKLVVSSYSSLTTAGDSR